MNDPRQSVFRLSVVDRPYEDPDALLLMDELDADLARVYGSGDREHVDPGAYARPAGLFLVGYTNDAYGETATACGAMRLRDDIEPGQLDAEIKRMYVKEDARRRGFGRAILAELVRVAAIAGARRAVLETGTKSADALRLYLADGFDYITPYSTEYADSPTNRGLARWIDISYPLRTPQPTC